MRFPIWAPGETVGEIILERRSLYWEYSASLDREFPGFVRLYLHGPDGSSRLGLFCRENQRLSLQGRISCRGTGRIAEPFCFSLMQEPFMPLAAYTPEPPLPFFAEKTEAGWTYCIPISEISDLILPYFCFFTHRRELGRDYVLLSLDASGTPFFQKIN